MDRSRLDKVLKAAAQERTARALGHISGGPNKETLRELAQQAAQSGVVIRKIPSVDPHKPKRKMRRARV